MHWTTNVSPLIKDIEFKHSPVIIRVNKFDEDDNNLLKKSNYLIFNK